MATITTRNEAAFELDRAQQHLSRLLLAEPRDLPAIIEAAEAVRRAEHLARQSAGRTDR